MVSALSAAVVAKGYPEDYNAAKGKIIHGLNSILMHEQVTVYGAGVKRDGLNYLINGGRLFHLVSFGESVADAKATLNQELGHLYNPCLPPEDQPIYFRSDIGDKEARRRAQLLKSIV